MPLIKPIEGLLSTKRRMGIINNDRKDLFVHRNTQLYEIFYQENMDHDDHRINNIIQYLKK
jgi:Flp pilus assembly CpaF family ATPase